MGTRFELLLSGSDERALNGLLDLLALELEEWDRRLSLFRSDSLVAHINRRAAERPVRLDGQTFSLLSTCLQVYRQSRGAFDVTVAPLMRAFGFHPGRKPLALAMAALAKDVLPHGSAPCGSAPHGSAPCGSDGLVLDSKARTVAFTRPGLAIDLGAVGKGFVLDLLVEQLGEERSLVDAALLHGGTSTVVAVGHPRGREGFDVLIRDTSTRLCLRDGALSVSSRAGRTVGHGKARRGHVIDPLSRRPAEGGPERAVVTGRSALLTDAWSTALLAAGPRPLRVPPELTCITVPVSDRSMQWTT